jgi:hydrogenase maturation protein HypF
MKSLNVRIKGIVQGVGFRPFIFKLAQELAVNGFITNTSDGVEMAVEGDNLDMFLDRVSSDAPPLARIMSIDVFPVKFSFFPDFSIKESSGSGRFTLLSPDISVCNDCLDEFFDLKDRRFLYPFINCTNCGPRYSITKTVPYDRINTTMNTFRMCEACLAEYQNPGNRRFHAQPNACPVCGPQMELIIQSNNTKISEKDNPVAKTIDMLRQGKVMAIKGLGGFHIACDATNREAVLKLRERKRRSNKPFALMAPDIDTIRKYCLVSENEEKVLLSHKRPIVLLQKRDDFSLSEEIAPNNRHIGFMLPYTPIHYLLFYHPDRDEMNYNGLELSVLVMTSGNITEEPIIHDNEEAYLKLSSVADAFLVHNRDIFMRVDDSVIKIRDQSLIKNSQNPLMRKYTSDPMLFFIRRSRGYVPEPILLPGDGPDVLGCGADLKNTFTITKGAYAIPSQHIGDMENYETLRFFEETLKNLKSVYKAEPAAVAYDLHPHYMSTQWALRLGQQESNRALKLFGIQHHYAHIGSVMAENGFREKVIGVAFDGNGYGEDGSLWGGEFLVADINGYKRAGHIKYTPLPGGEMAAREPWRMAISYLKEAAADEIMDFIGPTGFIEKYGRESVENIIKIASDRTFSPLSSSVGRLFDAVSALMGICDKNTFEGEAAIAIESMVIDGIEEYYPVDISFKDPLEIDFSNAVLKIINDMERHTDRRVIATKFHNTVASAVILVVLKLSLVNNIKKVILSGGVFQNIYLLGKVADNLRAVGLSVYTNELVPCSDAGISLGQAYIARERLRTRYDK